MSGSRVANRYALGLWDYALSVNEQVTIVDEMKSIIELIKQSKDFRLFLKSPIIEVLKKITIGKEIFKDNSKTVQNFFSLLVKNKRENELLNIANRILELNNEYLGIQRVTITSAVPLDDEMVMRVLKKMPGINPDKVEVENKVDETILGGYILRSKDQELDASVHTQLDNIKKKLKERVY